MTDLAGKCTLKELAETLRVPYKTLLEHAKASDFPAPSHVIANQRLYDRSRVARYLGVPLRA